MRAETGRAALPLTLQAYRTAAEHRQQQAQQYRDKRQFDELGKQLRDNGDPSFACSAFIISGSSPFGKRFTPASWKG